MGCSEPWILTPLSTNRRRDASRTHASDASGPPLLPSGASAGDLSSQATDILRPSDTECSGGRHAERRGGRGAGRFPRVGQRRGRHECPGIWNLSLRVWDRRQNKQGVAVARPIGN